MGKFRSLAVDTVNGLQSTDYFNALSNKDKVSFDTWRDWSVELMQTMNFFKRLDPYNIYQILISGYEGSGKTTGLYYLNPEETAIANQDKKPLSFPGWQKKYKKGKISEGGNYRDDIDSYDMLRGYIEAVYENRKDSGPFVIFYLAHIEDFKSTNGIIRQRMKTLGNMATKHNIEGSVIHNYYTSIDTNKKLDDLSRYQLSVQSDGYNTARSPMGYWTTPTIPNNFQAIIDRIMELEY